MEAGRHSWSTAAQLTRPTYVVVAAVHSSCVVSTRLSGLLKGHLLPLLNKAGADAEAQAEARPASARAKS